MLVFSLYPVFYELMFDAKTIHNVYEIACQLVSLFPAANAGSEGFDPDN
jgi:hypothetical protein